MANTESANDFNRLQAELFHRQTTSTSRKRRNKPSTPTTVTTKTTILVSPMDVRGAIKAKYSIYSCIIFMVKMDSLTEITTFGKKK